GGDAEADLVVVAEDARDDHQSVRAPVGDAVAVVDAVRAEDLDAARARRFSLLQLDEDAVARVAGADAVDDVEPLDAAPAADADADAGAARLAAAVLPAAALGDHALDGAVLQVVAAEPGRGAVVDVEVTEHGAHHVLQ